MNSQGGLKLSSIPPLKERNLKVTSSENDAANWREAKSPKGKTYYYNKITKETSWTPPSGYILSSKKKEDPPITPPPAPSQSLKNLQPNRGSIELQQANNENSAVKKLELLKSYTVQAIAQINYALEILKQVDNFNHNHLILRI